MHPAIRGAFGAFVSVLFLIASPAAVAQATADVSVTVTLDTPGPYIYNDTIQYTIVVSNAGPSTATGIGVASDTLNLNTLSVSGACTSFSACTIASLNPDASTTINVTARIAVAGTFSYSVTATAGESDPNTANNTDSDGGAATHSADLSITKTLDTAGPYSPGQSVQYTLTIANAGPSHAINVAVTDTPTNMTITSVSGACTSFPCTFFALLSGASTTVTVTATIDAAGPFDNAATVTNDRPDPDSSNNTDAAGNGGEATSADISVVKTLQSGGPFQPGDSVTYLIQVSNAGPDPATNIQVSDTPTNLTITSVSDGCTSLPCTIASMNPNNTQDIFVTATIDAEGAFDNSVTVAAAESDPDPSDNTDDTGNGGVTGPRADLSVAKSIITEGSYKQGQTVEFQTVVTNNGPSDATNVVVTDTPIGVTIVGGTVSGAGCTAFPCTISSLASGASVTITYSATINNPGAFDNSTSVTSDAFDPDTSNNSDPFGNGGVASNAVDVSITKTLATAGPYYPGQSIQYTLVVSNAGPGVALFVVVDDTPTNLTITGVSGGNCTAFPCTLTPGLTPSPSSNRTITVTATINGAGAFDNVATATVRSSDVDNDPSNNTDDTGNGGTTSADLSVAKSIVTEGPYKLGGTVQFQTVVTNNGPSDATSVVVTDTPVGVSIVAGSVSGAGCTAFPCTIPSLANGASATITYSATIASTGSFDNSTTVSAAEYDPDTSNNTDPFGNGGVASNAVDVSITKTLVTPGPYYPGQSIQYTLVVSNASGPGVALFVVVDDTPTNLTITGVSGGNCSALPCTLQPGLTPTPSSNRTITVTATINSAGTFDNMATATVRSSDIDNDPSNNTDDTGNGGTTSADLSVAKSIVTAGPYKQGQTVQFQTAVTNNGPSSATNVVVTDTPIGVNLVAGSISGAGCTAFPCTISSLANGASATITYSATIQNPGAFDNSATVTAAEYDHDTSNNSDLFGNGGVASNAVDVSITKTLDTPGPYYPGQSIQYTLVVSNAPGPGVALFVVVNDIPTNLTITSVSGGNCTAFPCTIVPGLTPTPASNRTITVTATINSPGAFDNVATATVRSSDIDNDPSNNTDDTGNGGTAVAGDVSITKTLDTAGPFATGQTVTYTIVLTNNSLFTLADNPGNELDDVLPAGLALVSATATGGSVSANTGANTVTWNGSLASGGSVTITVNATITALSGTISNQGVAHADLDNDGTNETDVPSDDPSTATNDDSTTFTIDTVADLFLTMDYLPANPGQNDHVTYTLVLTNNGPLAATNAVVTDDLPDSADLLSASSTQGSCTTADPVVCNVGNLASGASATMTVIVKTPGNYDSLTSSASAVADQADPTPATASASFNCMKIKKGVLKPCGGN